MTREELYYKPCSTCHNHDCVFVGKEDTHEVCEDYQTIKALEQETTLASYCKLEDCIRRDDVWDVMQELWGTSGELIDRLMALPSVTPQEPFINKPCVSSEVCEHDKNKVLDKIRAEIDGIEINGQIDEHTSFIRTGEQVKQMALNIIDKYRAEIEPQESEE